MSVILDESRQSAASMNLVARQVGECSARHGFRSDMDDADFLAEMAKEVRDLSAKAHPDPVVVNHPGVQGLEKHRMMAERLESVASRMRMMTVTSKLMLIVSELAEALEAIRTVEDVDRLMSTTNFEEELADAQIRLFDLAHMVGANIGDAIMEKAGTNEGRSYKHGKKM